MKTYFELTDEELFTISDNDLTDAINRAALDKGIEIPISIPDAIKQSGFAGYVPASNNTKVYRIVYTGGYAHERDGAFVYLTKADAERALFGLVKVEPVHEAHTYRTIGQRISESQNFAILEEEVGVNQTRLTPKALTDASMPSDNFIKFRNECMEDYNTRLENVAQKRRLAAAKKEFLRLAGGNEDIAKNFWNKTYTSDWATA